jgi:hypothetical protein
MKLEGLALDWAVMKALGMLRSDNIVKHTNGKLYAEGLLPLGYNPQPESYFDISLDGNGYHNDWSLAGPIIKREKISLVIEHDGWWVASIRYGYSDEEKYLQLDHDPIVAAM